MEYKYTTREFSTQEIAQIKNEAYAVEKEILEQDMPCRKSTDFRIKKMQALAETMKLKLTDIIEIFTEFTCEYDMDYFRHNK